MEHLLEARGDRQLVAHGSAARRSAVPVEPEDTAMKSQLSSRPPRQSCGQRMALQVVLLGDHRQRGEVLHVRTRCGVDALARSGTRDRPARSRPHRGTAPARLPAPRGSCRLSSRRWMTSRRSARPACQDELRSALRRTARAGTGHDGSIVTALSGTIRRSAALDGASRPATILSQKPGPLAAHAFLAGKTAETDARDPAAAALTAGPVAPQLEALSRRSLVPQQRLDLVRP